MEIKAELLAGERLSKQKAVAIAEYAAASPETFRELVACFLSEDPRLVQRAAHSLSIAARKNPELVQPFTGTLVQQLGRTDVHNAVLRNSARILECVPVPEEFHAELIETAFRIIQDRQSAIAVRVFSLTIVYNLSRIYPELGTELKFVIEERLPFESAAFKSRAAKILASIDRRKEGV
ncbi:hypothetical protein [Dyadobacter crusticola]|uniref:hypothetical protein n=1 Tax=Dyadobacter crusticola TaxID=292407 RepID=UPI0004E24513|nr:hypothetical protein [Dyadobacter crusticola]